MRQIATMPEEQARPFADYLLTLGITTRIDCSDNGCAVWVHKEDLLDRAREELRAFQQNPGDPRYREAKAEAESIRRRSLKVEQDYARRSADLRNRMDRRMSGRLGPLTRTLVITCVAIFAINWLSFHGSALSPLYRALYFTEWYVTDDRHLVNEGIGSILSGQIWRLITPIFGHGNLMHLFFNMYMLVMLGGGVERRRGSKELALLVLFSALVSNVAQFYLPDLFTVPAARRGDGPFLGMSGVLYGLFGYCWMRGRYDPASGLQLHPQTVTLLLIWLVICAFNLLGPIANTAHVAGMLAGMAFAFAAMWRDGVRW